LAADLEFVDDSQSQAPAQSPPKQQGATMTAARFPHDTRSAAV